MAKFADRRTALVPYALILVLSAQLCTAFLDGDELSPGTPTLSPAQMRAMGINSTQPSARAIAGQRLSSLVLGPQTLGSSVSKGNPSLQVTASPFPFPPTTVLLVGANISITTAFSDFPFPSIVSITLKRIDPATNQEAVLAAYTYTIEANPSSLRQSQTTIYSQPTAGHVQFQATACYREVNATRGDPSFRDDCTLLSSNIVTVTFAEPVLSVLSLTPSGLTPNVGDTTIITAAVMAGINGPAIPGVTVSLVRDGQVVATTTDANGRATFSIGAWTSSGQYPVTLRAVRPTWAGGPDLVSSFTFYVDVFSFILTASPLLQVVGRPVDLTATLALRGAPLALPNTLTLKISNQQAAGDVSVGSKTATNIALPQTLSATYTGPAAPGEQKFQAIAVLETTGTMQASTPNVVKSAVAAVTFVAAPTTTLSTPTTNPTLGDDSTIKAILTNGPGGLPLGDATVTFTLTQPDGKQVLYTFKTDSTGEAVAPITWSEAGHWTVTATTLAAGLQAGQEVDAKNSLTIDVSPVFSRIALIVRAKPDYETRDDSYRYSGSAEGYARSPMPVILIATVQDDGGAAISGVTVIFNIVHPCKYGRGLCGAVPQAVTDAHGQATVNYRTSTSRDSYVVATARNNRGTVVSSQRLSLWCGDLDGYGYP